MSNILREFNFDKFFKISMLLILIYFLVLLTKVAMNLENGRYQYDNQDNLIIDTKTGIVKQPD